MRDDTPDPRTRPHHDHRLEGGRRYPRSPEGLACARVRARGSGGRSRRGGIPEASRHLCDSRTGARRGSRGPRTRFSWPRRIFPPYSWTVRRDRRHVSVASRGLPLNREWPGGLRGRVACSRLTEGRGRPSIVRRLACARAERRLTRTRARNSHEPACRSVSLGQFAPEDSDCRGVYLRAWAEEEQLHSGSTLLRLLDQRFRREHLARGPYFFPDLARATEKDERTAIATRQIRATRIDYVGTLH